MLSSLSRRPANILGNVIEAFVAPDELSALNAHPAVRTVEAVQRDTPRVVSQGRTAHNAQNWITGGFTGAGVKVGIIDRFLGIQALMGTELPATIIGRCYSSIGVWSSNLSACDAGNSHGTGVVESLVDIAPSVQLFIANPISRIDFANTVDWMVSLGVTVINYSAARFWDGPGNGTSPFSDSPLIAVNSAVTGGAVFVTAAGNEARATWFGPWRDIDFDGRPEFGLTSDTELNSVFLLAGETITVQLRWQDSWVAASRDIDLGLRHSVLGLVASSLEQQSGIIGHTPFEVLSYTAPISGNYSVLLNHFAGGIPSWFQVQAFTSQALQYHTVSGSIGNPAESANSGLLAVGAAAWDTPAVIEYFSSQGPTPDGRIKPEIVGADRADTVTAGPGGFIGTSQASPHVARLAPLVKGPFPSYSPAQVANYLKQFALPRGAVPNDTWGYGFAYLANLCSYTVTPSPASVGAAGGLLNFNVTAGAGCGWTAVPNAAWLAIQSGASGSGNGIVTVSVAANSDGARAGTLNIAGVTVTVNQAAAIVLPPSEPRNFTAAVVGNSVTFMWVPPLRGTPTGYSLEAGSASGLADLATLPLGNVLTFTTLAPNGTFFVRLRAFSTVGPSPPSNELVLVVGPTLPGVPTGLQVTISGANASFMWNAPGTGGSPTSYRLEASLTPGGAIIAILTVRTNALVVPNIPPGTYYVRVRAVNDVGMSAPSNEVAVILAGVQVPGAPAGLTFTVVGSAVTLQWSPPTTGGLVTGYTLHAGSATGLSNLAVVPVGSSISFATAGVPPGTYFVRVVASNAAGAGPPSSEATVIVGAADR